MAGRSLGRVPARARRSASATSWPASTGSGSRSSPTPSSSASTPCRPCLMLALILALTVGVAAAVVALRRWRSHRGAGAGLRRRLGDRRAVPRRPRAAVPLEPGRLGLGDQRRLLAGRGLHRHLWPEPADRGGGRRSPHPCSCAGAGAPRVAIAAAGRLRPDRARRRGLAPVRGARCCRTPTSGCASSRPTSRSTTNGIPSCERPGSAVISSSRARAHDPPAQIVIWPESAVPYDVEVEPEVRNILAEAYPAGRCAARRRRPLRVRPPAAGRAQQPVRGR